MVDYPKFTLTLLQSLRIISYLNMMVIRPQVLVVTMERLIRSLRMSHARCLVPGSLVVREATIRPDETGSLRARGKWAVKGSMICNRKYEFTIK